MSTNTLFAFLLITTGVFSHLQFSASFSSSSHVIENYFMVWGIVLHKQRLKRFPLNLILHYANSYLIKVNNVENNRQPLGQVLCCRMVGGNNDGNFFRIFHCRLWTLKIGKTAFGLYVKYFVLQEKFRDEQDEGKYITTLYINLQRLWRNLGRMTWF